MLQLKQSGRKGGIIPSSALCSTQALNRLGAAHPHWGGQSTLLSALIQMLTSPPNSHTHTQK